MKADFSFSTEEVNNAAYYLIRNVNEKVANAITDWHFHNCVICHAVYTVLSIVDIVFAFLKKIILSEYLSC